MLALTRHHAQRGFTLIELSIVLVIIGLIVGGVLVGRDLIGASYVRAQISQIEKYQTAVNTFRGKYNYMPGDIPDPDAMKFGFIARGPLQGTGDGNGMMEGIVTYSGVYPIGMVPNGEVLVFWVDLSTAKLLDANFTFANSTTLPASGGVMTPTNPINPLKQVIPFAAIGQSNYITVYSDSGVNYFGLQATTAIGNSASYASPGLTVNQAFAIDQKTDDGMPGLGTVIADYQNGYQCGATPTCIPHSYSTTAVAASALSCFDNDNTAGRIHKYSLTQNNGTGVNCALSFKFR